MSVFRCVNKQYQYHSTATPCGQQIINIKIQALLFFPWHVTVSAAQL